MGFRYILLDEKGHIATFTLSRPEKIDTLKEIIFGEVGTALPQ